MKKSYWFIILMIALASCSHEDTKTQNLNSENNKENPEFIRYKDLISDKLNKAKTFLNSKPDSSLFWADSCIIYCNTLDSLKISEDGGSFVSKNLNLAEYNKGLALIELNKKKEGYSILEEIFRRAPELSSKKLCDYYFDRRQWKKAKTYCNNFKCDDCIYKVAYSTYKKDGKGKAIEFLKKHINTTNEDKVVELYDKLNPIYKVREFAHSECCDGTTSYSRGRGTCSHHGGVCSEVYETIEKRKY